MNGTEMNGKVTANEAVDERTATQELTLINVPTTGFSIEKEIAEIEKGIELFNRIKIVALKLTKPTDWVDQGASMYLMDRGAENIAIAFGVDISDVSMTLEWAEDAKGRYYMYIAKGKAYSKRLGRWVEDYGVCSQRDKFFGMIGGKLKEIEEVDKANILRKATTNLYNRLIKRVVGLSGVTIDDLKASGMDTTKIGHVEYKGRAQKAAAALSPAAKEQRDKLWNMILEIAVGDEDEARLILKRISRFEDKDKNIHELEDIERLTSEKWIASLYGKTKKEWEKVLKERGVREPGEEG